MSEANVTESKKGPTPKKEKVKGAPKVRTGYVVSDKMSKTSSSRSKTASSTLCTAKSCALTRRLRRTMRKKSQA